MARRSCVAVDPREDNATVADLLKPRADVAFLATVGAIGAIGTLVFDYRHPAVFEFRHEIRIEFVGRGRQPIGKRGPIVIGTPGFNKARTEALLEYSTSQPGPGLSGQDIIIFFTKKAGHWRETGRILVSVS